MTTQLTGVFITADGVAYPNAVIEFRPATRSIIGTASGVRVPTAKRVQADNDGSITIELIPGSYIASVVTDEGRVSVAVPVPDTASSIDIATIIGGEEIVTEDFVSSWAMPPKVVSGTTYTVLTSDGGLGLVTTSNSDVAITLPNDAPAGLLVGILQKGAGQFTLSAEAGGSLNHPQNLTKAYAQNSFLSVWCAENSDGASAYWVAFGDMV